MCLIGAETENYEHEIMRQLLPHNTSAYWLVIQQQMIYCVKINHVRLQLRRFISVMDSLLVSLFLSGNLLTS